MKATLPKAGWLPSDILLVGLAIVLVFGNRVVVPTGGLKIPIIAIYVPFTISIWLKLGKVKIESIRLYLYHLAMFMVILSSLLSINYSEDFSVFSLLYLIILYFPVVFVYQNPQRLPLLLSAFQRSMFVIAIIGIAQFITQLIGIPYRDLLLNYFPRFIDEFNTSIPLYRGSDLIRSNGLFLLEPSFYSQYLAVAILIDIFYFRKFARLFVYVPAILFSFAGTGLIVLIAGLVTNTWKIPLKRFLIPAGLILIAVLVFLSTDFGQILINRLGEFRNPNASAYNRFIAPFQSFSNFFSMDLEVIMFGGGAGSIDTFREMIREQIPVMHPNLFIKLFFEYGLLTGLVFMTFVVTLFYRRRKLAFITLPLFLMYSIVSSGLLNAQQLYFCYALGMLFVQPISKRKKITIGASTGSFVPQH